MYIIVTTGAVDPVADLAFRDVKLFTVTSQ